MHGMVFLGGYASMKPVNSSFRDNPCLKLPSLLTAWLFWTFHIKSHNMKALVILSHSWSPFLPLICLYGEKNECLWVCVAFWNIFLRKNSHITHANHMTMITSGWIWSWPDYCKTKENVSIMLDLCLFTFYSAHTNESTWHWLLTDLISSWCKILMRNFYKIILV